VNATEWEQRVVEQTYDIAREMGVDINTFDVTISSMREFVAIARYITPTTRGNIRWSRMFVAVNENNVDAIRSVAVHEIAHLIIGIPKPTKNGAYLHHTKEHREICRRFGVDADGWALGTLLVRKPWYRQCPECNSIFDTHVAKPRSAKKQCVCPVCKTHVVAHVQHIDGNQLIRWNGNEFQPYDASHPLRNGTVFSTGTIFTANKRA